jgi:hypothetical protein
MRAQQQSNVFYLPSFSTPARTRRTHRPEATWLWTNEDATSVEFSDYGRSGRFLSGWWIFPGLFIAGLISIFAI